MISEDLSGAECEGETWVITAFTIGAECGVCLEHIGYMPCDQILVDAVQDIEIVLLVRLALLRSDRCVGHGGD